MRTKTTQPPSTPTHESDLQFIVRARDSTLFIRTFGLVARLSRMCVCECVCCVLALFANRACQIKPNKYARQQQRNCVNEKCATKCAEPRVRECVRAPGCAVCVYPCPCANNNYRPLISTQCRDLAAVDLCSPCHSVSVVASHQCAVTVSMSHVRVCARVVRARFCLTGVCSPCVCVCYVVSAAAAVCALHTGHSHHRFHVHTVVHKH